VCKTEHSNAITGLNEDTKKAIAAIRLSNRALLKGTTFTPIPRRANPFYPAGSGEKLPPLLERLDFDAKDLLADNQSVDASIEKLSATDWDMVGLRALNAMVGKGLTESDIKVEIQKCLAWIYQVRKENWTVYSDQLLLNGPLLRLTVEVLEEL
jgi:hypothetical protein